MTAQKIINVGVTENDGTGDSIQTAGNKINHNFSQLYTDNVIESVQMTWIENNIQVTASNANLKLTASGTGAVVLAGVKLSGTSISSQGPSGIDGFKAGKVHEQSFTKIFSINIIFLVKLIIDIK